MEKIPFEQMDDETKRRLFYLCRSTREATVAIDHANIPILGHDVGKMICQANSLAKGVTTPEPLKAVMAGLTPLLDASHGHLGVLTLLAFNLERALACIIQVPDSRNIYDALKEWYRPYNTKIQRSAQDGEVAEENFSDQEVAESELVDTLIGLFDD